MSKNKYHIFYFLIPLFVFSNCESQKCSSKVFLTDALEIMENNYLFKDSINWDNIKKEALKKKENIHTINDAIKILDTIIYNANDKHSYILKSKDVEKYFSNDYVYDSIKSKLIQNKIGYLKIPSFVGNKKLSKKFALEIQTRIKKIDQNNIKHWIIDLSDNEGGDMWPMYLGLAPILKKGISGYFIEKGDYKSWSYSKGAVFMNKDKQLSINNYYTIKNKNSKISIIISDKTSSSGEMLTVMFKGMKNVTFYGERTGGFLTANNQFKLCDGSIFSLATSIVADRKKVIYQKNIYPDIKTDKPIEVAINNHLQK